MATQGSPGYFIKLAKSLPPPLLRFFERYPPKQICPKGRPPTNYQLQNENPFKPTKHPVTGRVHNPKYSLRRQANLVKAARKFHIEDLLPESIKKTEVRLAKKVKFGSRVKGTGVGQTPKGHKHERNLENKMEQRREAMLKMPELIRRWKAVGRKNWTEWPN